MAVILSHPFRLEVDGSIAVVDQDTETADAEQLAVLVLTVTGERPLVPSFGVPDPTFAALSVGDVNAGIGTFGPPITVDAVDVTRPDDRTQTATLTFSPE